MIHDSTIRRAPRYRPSFTLVELLVAIAIIGVMAGMVLMALDGARRDARVARTRGTIEKINDIILHRWEEYRYRSVKLNLPPEWLLPKMTGANPEQPILSPREGARLRMIALRDMMRMEMPDRFTDILYPPVRYRAMLDFPSGRTFMYTDDTGLGRAVPAGFNQIRNYFGFVSIGNSFGVTTLTTDHPYLPPMGGRIPGRPPLNFENQQAELLYAIVALTQYNGGPALEHFRPTEIGDTDGDGYPEFLDAWGRPIRWLRWPAGFPSELNQAYRNPQSSVTGNADDTPSAPDALDPLRTDWRWNPSMPELLKPWTLVPLIVSAGEDGVFEMIFDPANSAGEPVGIYAGELWGSPPAPTGYGNRYFNVDPYMQVVLNGTSYFIGAPYDEGSAGSVASFDELTDNITNHDILMD